MTSIATNTDKCKQSVEKIYLVSSASLEYLATKHLTALHTRQDSGPMSVDCRYHGPAGVGRYRQSLLGSHKDKDESGGPALCQDPPAAGRNVFSYPHISTLNIYLTNVDPGLHNLDLLTQS